jgi:hypothetical protein
MEHNYHNDPVFMERIENLMNIAPYFKPFGDESLNDAFITIYDMTAKYVIDNNVDFYATDEYLNRIKEMFWANKDRTNLFNNNGKTNVAVHVRRPNIVDNRVLGSDTPDDFYLNAIQRIRNEYSELSQNGNLVFHIYSQGSLDLFQSYIADDTELHIDEEIEPTFISMVAADMLITSFSSLSYIAGFLSDGIIYYHPFWHPPRNNWIRL